MRKFTTKIASQQNSVNIVFGILYCLFGWLVGILGVQVGLLGILVGVHDLLYGALSFYLDYLVF